MNRNEFIKQLHSYAIVPKEVLVTPELSHIDKLLYILLLSNQPTFSPTLSYLSKSLNISLKTLYASRKRLVDKKLIVILQKRGKPCQYQFTHCSKWEI